MRQHTALSQHLSWRRDGRQVQGIASDPSCGPLFLPPRQDMRGCPFWLEALQKKISAMVTILKAL